MRALTLGLRRAIEDAAARTAPFVIDPAHLVTHAVVTGMTGSGKTGLLLVMVEEAVAAGVPVLLFDVKGDLANIGLALDPHAPDAVAQHSAWLSPATSAVREHDDERATAIVAERAKALHEWNLRSEDIPALRRRTALRVLTPGSTAVEPVNLLSSLDCSLDRWNSDIESSRDRLAATLSMILRLVDRDADPAASREHVLLSTLAEHMISTGQRCSLHALLAALEAPPIANVGAMTVDDFVSPDERRALAAALNALLASPSFACWREGAALDVQSWLTLDEGDDRTPVVVVSLSHLDDNERIETLAVLLEEVRAWVRSLPGTERLRALVVLDEAFGLLPPHPANPPTRRPLVSMLKQGRAYGVGLVVATQNPMDLDYRALSNAGLWFVGRLQTDADRKRVIEGLAGEGDRRAIAKTLSATVRKLRPRWFVVRNARAGDACEFLRVRESLCWLRGPMTRSDLRRLAGGG